MLEQVIQIIRENNRIPEDVVITRDSRLDTDIGLSSFDLMECLTTVEETFRLEIPKDRIPEFRTLGDVMDCLEEIAGKKSE